MGFPKGFKRDFKGLEARRLRAVKLLKRGHRQAEVARRVGVHRQSVSRWAKVLQKQGQAGLLHLRAGRLGYMEAGDLKKIEQGLILGPAAFGYYTELWTAPRVGRLIQRLTGVRYHPDHVYRILQRLGWSCQRPTGRAIERDEKAIRRWKKIRWPEVKKKPVGKAEPSFLSTNRA